METQNGTQSESAEWRTVHAKVSEKMDRTLLYLDSGMRSIIQERCSDTDRGAFERAWTEGMEQLKVIRQCDAILRTDSLVSGVERGPEQKKKTCLSSVLADWREYSATVAKRRARIETLRAKRDILREECQSALQVEVLQEERDRFWGNEALRESNAAAECLLSDARRKYLAVARLSNISRDQWPEVHDWLELQKAAGNDSFIQCSMLELSFSGTLGSLAAGHELKERDLRSVVDATISEDGGINADDTWNPVHCGRRIRRSIADFLAGEEADKPPKKGQRPSITHPLGRPFILEPHQIPMEAPPIWTKLVTEAASHEPWTTRVTTARTEPVQRETVPVNTPKVASLLDFGHILYSSNPPLAPVVESEVEETDENDSRVGKESTAINSPAKGTGIGWSFLSQPSAPTSPRTVEMTVTAVCSEEETDPADIDIAANLLPSPVSRTPRVSVQEPSVFSRRSSPGTEAMSVNQSANTRRMATPRTLPRP